MRHLLSLAVLVMLPCAGSSMELEPTPAALPDNYELITNSPLKARLQASGRTINVRGSVSLHVRYAPELAATGRIEVRAINVTFFDVPQRLLSGRSPPRSADKAGLLGFALRGAVAPQFLKYDAREHIVSGDIPVRAYFTQLRALFAEGGAAESSGGSVKARDYERLRTVPGRIDVTLRLGGAPSELTTDESPPGDFAATATVPRYAARGVVIEPFSVSVPDPAVKVRSAHVDQMEPASKLCIKPVIIRTGPHDATATGASLEAGMKVAADQWTKKANVVFDVQAPAVINDGSFKTVSFDDEEGNWTKLRRKGNQRGCVEVYFVREFKPKNFFDGGVTFDGGTADAKVVIAEGPPGTPLDPTFLAHELGHVLGLTHPDEPPDDDEDLFQATAGTLMCAAEPGVLRPQRNSLENVTNIRNSLLTSFRFLPKTPADCAGGRCGRCP
jgi:hypothetical protein